jgi:toxin ParE1/3/4
MRVSIREAAYDDLNRIHAWIAKDRPQAADRAVERILDGAERLGQFPYMGHIGRAPGTYEWVVPGSHTFWCMKFMLWTIWSRSGFSRCAG